METIDPVIQVRHLASPSHETKSQLMSEMKSKAPFRWMFDVPVSAAVKIANVEDVLILSNLQTQLETRQLSCTSRQIDGSTIPPSFRSESIHLPPTVQSNIGSRNDMVESHTNQASIAFGDEPDLTSHRWSESMNSPTPAQSIAGLFSIHCQFIEKSINRKLFDHGQINADGNGRTIRKQSTR